MTDDPPALRRDPPSGARCSATWPCPVWLVGPALFPALGKYRSLRPCQVVLFTGLVVSSRKDAAQPSAAELRRPLPSRASGPSPCSSPSRALALQVLPPLCAGHRQGSLFCPGRQLRRCGLTAPFAVPQGLCPSPPESQGLKSHNP